MSFRPNTYYPIVTYFKSLDRRFQFVSYDKQHVAIKRTYREIFTFN